MVLLVGGVCSSLTLGKPTKLAAFYCSTVIHIQYIYCIYIYMLYIYIFMYINALLNRKAFLESNHHLQTCH